MSARALNPQPASQRRVRGIPEIYFDKQIDNSRLVRQPNAARTREMWMFSLALSCLFIFGMLYAWQHFRSIEYGYTIEQAVAERDRLAELNRALRVEDASLRDPGRIDVLARRMGLQSPVPGQVMRLDTSYEPAQPMVASAAGISVIAVAQQ